MKHPRLTPLAAALALMLGSPVALAATSTIYYKPATGWTGTYIHYGINGSWTAAPGIAMDSASCAGWKVKTIDIGSAASVSVAFNNGAGSWDSKNGANYTIAPGVHQVSGGAINAGDPCATGSNSATVWYYTRSRAWPGAYIHYSVNGTWTAAPGTAMSESACADWARKTVSLGAATTITAAFNNGAGSWDNNNSGNYTIGIGASTVRDGIVTPNAASPCPAPDTVAPSVPQAPSASAVNTTITLRWSASTDNVGVTAYEITRSGGAGTVTLTSSANQLTDNGLQPRTSYSYNIKALDAAGNKSGASAAAVASTGDAPPVSAGTPLGTDMREDAVYFVMTARFFDGDSANNRGGSQHVGSGNVSYDDPMFRGDFKGLIARLDYIKALGFSAIWITPVTLNRSDYDFHGYHTYDFYQIDGRLESPGASYQDLINAAHAKGIKIMQDIVINHSSRWGARGLYTPKVFGIRDSKWSWYYDAPNPGFTYDGISVEPSSGKNYYNGDMWSTPEPAGNTCRNWGVATTSGNYNCQWPSATSGMFPAKYYHQCWIGNWEGEDSRSCWLHEDLADLNTENAEVQQHLLGAYKRFIDMGVDGFRIDTAVHVPRVTWNRRFLPQLQAHAQANFGDKGKHFYMVGEVGAFVNDKWNRGSVNHSAQFFTWKERKEYVADDVQAALDQYHHENTMGTSNQPTSTNAFLNGNSYRAPDYSKFSGMNIIDMRMHMNFSDAGNAFWNGKDSDDSVNDATYNLVYVDAHDFGPNKSKTAYAGGTAAWAENMSLMWTFRGIPTLFQGSEIEFQAGKEIDCGPTCALETTRRAYFGKHLEGSVTAGDFGVTAASSGTVAATLSAPLVKHVQRLNQIRRKIPALQKGQYSTEDVAGGIAYKRRYTSGAVDSFALVSVSGGATFNGIPNGTYKDAVTGDVRTVTNGSLSTSVSGQGNARIYVLDLPGNPAPGKIGVDGPFLKP